MLQFVRVNYESARDVYVDGEVNGQTNKIIRVDEAPLKFDLGSPKAYTPEFYESQVTNPTAIKPLDLYFTAISNGD